MGKAYLDQAFQNVLTNGDKIFVPYIMAGDGGLDQLPKQIKLLEDAGASAIELGIPFSDPVADGPTIQEAGIRALEEGVGLNDILDVLIKTKDDRKIPVILMTYINPIYRFGVKPFSAKCSEAGVDGLIIPDIPLEEESLVADALAEQDIALIRLVALTSPKDRQIESAKRTEGFLYAVTVTGTTGERKDIKENVSTYLDALKEMSDCPVLAGFGVSTPDQVKQLSKACDGVVVGSKIVKSLHENDHQPIYSMIQAAKN
ncbi:tryptophan synthase, alpha chain [Pelagirhabdus alkalitolerans]|uniref:Tryptophan synthase alpha chain n=1 Tax=Pelagirhabdus alkalitolerans TaxID=1612202 RepID=A0A1G6GLF7_9BACI|nr:tryptophan synthase subunit alpha [Pelagirhabdus alkalitolerans]SDB82006.1 tryptophan synthase, alpha chain [Pelagirhabdus alkalitolerans]